MLKYRFKASKSSVSTDTIAWSVYLKNLLKNHNLSVGIVICPILSDTIAFVTKKFAYTYDGFIRLKGTVA